MGIRVVLETERGAKLEELCDTSNVLHRILPTLADEEFPLLRFIDRYGDTVFNRLQIEEFLKEWTAMKRRATGPEEKRLLSRIEEMAQKCAVGPHLYLKFYGD